MSAESTILFQISMTLAKINTSLAQIVDLMRVMANVVPRGFTGESVAHKADLQFRRQEAIKVWLAHRSLCNQCKYVESETKIQDDRMCKLGMTLWASTLLRMYGLDQP